jgi:hypothetical protein
MGNVVKHLLRRAYRLPVAHRRSFAAAQDDKGEGLKQKPFQISIRLVAPIFHYRLQGGF